jgi:hypothetical protein
LIRVGTELKINPSWYNLLLVALERKRTLIHEEVTNIKRREEIQLEVKK